jgi:hypothetical protein
VTRTWPARPSCAAVIDSSEKLEVLLCTSPPVIVAMSSSLRSRRSPKPGARTATHGKIPFTWLCTSMLSAGPSTFSATISSGAGSRMIFSSSGMSSCTREIFSLLSSTYGLSSTASSEAGLVTRYGETNPLSNSNPSTNSTVMPCTGDSSTVTVPPSPTVCSARASTAPTASSSFAEIAATRA